MLNFHTRYGNVFSYIHTENGDRVEKVIISGRWKYKSMTAEMDFLHSLKKKKKKKSAPRYTGEKQQPNIL